MVKSRSPKELIESAKNPKCEHAYIKFPGRKIEEVSDSEQEGKVVTNWSKVEELSRKNNNRMYTHIHTHPVSNQEEHSFAHIPSAKDIQGFIYDDNEKTAIIAKTNANTGELEGYTILRKTKNTPRSGYNRLPGFYNRLKNIFTMPQADARYFDDHLQRYSNRCEIALEKKDYTDLEEATKVLAKEFDLQYRFVPTKKYSGVVRRESGKLEKVTIAASIIGTIGGLFLLSSNITGNAIANVSQSSGNILGAVLLVVGLVAGFFWVKKK
jgi:hypothetical protein